MTRHNFIVASGSRHCRDLPFDGFLCLCFELIWDMINQHINNIIRLKAFTVRLECGHDAMSQDGVRDRFDILSGNMEPTFQNRTGFGAKD